MLPPNTDFVLGEPPNTGWELAAPKTDGWEVAAPKTEGCEVAAPKTEGWEVAAPNTEVWEVAALKAGAVPNDGAFWLATPNSAGEEVDPPKLNTLFETALAWEVVDDEDTFTFVLSEKRGLANFGAAMRDFSVAGLLSVCLLAGV